MHIFWEDLIKGEFLLLKPSIIPLFDDELSEVEVDVIIVLMTLAVGVSVKVVAARIVVDSVSASKVTSKHQRNDG